jgi:diguanylate cyclase (GGDEF)-like protein
MEQNVRLTEGELARLDLFRGVDPSSIVGLLANCPVRDLSEGEILIRAGQPNRHLYLLISGRLRIHLIYGDEPLTTLEAGEAVGEISLIDGQATTAFVVADCPCRVLQVDAHVLWSLVQTSHAAAFNLLLILAQRLRRDNSVITKTRELQREWEHYATIDCLTGLYNRRWLDGSLPKLIQRCRMGATQLSVIVIDIDGFKEYNDSFGHLAGDRAIFAVATALSGSLRPGDMLARFGGDEFVALLPDADIRLAAEIALRLHGASSPPPMPASLDGVRFPDVTVSLGFAEMGASDSSESLIASADKALYRAKQGGRNCVRSCSAESDRALHILGRAAGTR